MPFFNKTTQFAEVKGLLAFPCCQAATLANSGSQSALDKETSCLEAFSDGVFAIAIALLILEIRVPDLHVESNSNLLSALGRL